MSRNLEPYLCPLQKWLKQSVISTSICVELKKSKRLFMALCLQYTIKPILSTPVYAGNAIV